MDPSKLERLFEQQLKLMEMLAEAKLSSRAPASSPALPQSVDGITNSISEFTYDPDANITFDTWFRRYEDLFRVDFADKDDAWKVRLLLRKLGPSELDKYCNLILPQNPRDRTFDATIQSLSQLFGDHRSLFNTRYRCLKLVMNESDDFLTHIGIVNRECERFKLKSLTDDQFKSLVFICSLQSSKFADIRTRLLNRLEQDTFLDIKCHCGRISAADQPTLRDITLIQSGGQGGSEVHAVPASTQVGQSYTWSIDPYYPIWSYHWFAPSKSCFKEAPDTLLALWSLALRQVLSLQTTPMQALPQNGSQRQFLPIAAILQPISFKIPTRPFKNKTGCFFQQSRCRLPKQRRNSP